MPTWTERVWREFHAGTLTRGMRDVLLTLRTYRGRGGLMCPGHETLADRARCSVSTVQRTLRQAHQLGLVVWFERRVRASWRWLRTSNAYSLVVPETPIDATMRPTWRKPTTGQSDRGGERLEEKDAQQGHQQALTAMLQEAAQMPDLLALRRATIEARLLGHR
jgi:DNA-binding transcriptional MocR family regulator